MRRVLARSCIAALFNERAKKKKFERMRVAVGSPYGCEHGDEVEPGASEMPIGTPYSNPCNPAILQGAHGLGIEGISIHRHYVALQYRAESLTHIAVMTKDAAAEDFLAGRPWKFTELVPHALEDDWDVDESVDEINEERAEVWGALDQLAAAQGEGWSSGYLAGYYAANDQKGQVEQNA